ncbi:AAA domain-containing protein [Desulfocicer vacuolatum DSM 3385]|uniref:AAA domain-containing protein n=1 Tax=Desulfocicer vacuolatum DSM 3385 TaxID=1121400 RepID=A0A1W2CC48_9BACT|nr:AAA domain-containing protein [Desulfocicer vacuolatum DSM 3385]
MSNNPKIHTYKTLPSLITRLRDDLNNKDFVLLYAYNCTGKTRISMEFKEWGKRKRGIERDTLYFNAYTEDLFHWHNDLENDNERYLKINADSNFFNGFKELALENKIRPYLHRYADFEFIIDYERWIITFSHGDADHIKISRGEENIFIWCIFLAICELTIDGLGAYDWVKYLYIDDPISSLDDNNAIAVASDLAQLLKKDRGHLKTVISSHHGLFFNVMCHELKRLGHKKYFLHRKSGSDTYTLRPTNDTPFFNHIAMLSELQQASESGKLYTHHFNMLRNILEKTATFFGFDDFSHCIKGVDDEILYARALNLLSHGGYSVYEPREMVDDTKELFKKILSAFLNRYRFDLPELIIEQNPQENQS